MEINMADITKYNGPLSKNELEAIQKLAKTLEEYEESQNKVSITEFNRFGILFVSESAETVDPKLIIDISNEFIRRFNPYREIEVYGVDNELLFKVPQLFVPINGISDKYVGAVDRFKTDGTSNIPRWAAEATADLLNAILKSQKENNLGGFDSFADYIRHLRAEYAAVVKSFNTKDIPTVGVTPAKKAAGEDLSGMSWE
jgi:hypothetical protein